MPDAVCVVDAEGRFLFVSAGFERILGYASGEVIGRRAFDFVHPDDREMTMRQAERINAGLLQRHFRNRYIHKDGHTIDLQWSARFLAEFGVRVAVGHDVTELCQAERALEHLASHDDLTGLLNRHRLHADLRHAVQHAAAVNGGLALLYIDLDGFKAANDLHGHATGDQILQQVAQRLQQGVRRSDIVARMGGDEFIVLLPGCPDLATARSVADGLIARLSQPFDLLDIMIQLGASVGIACYPADGQDPDTLLAHADRLMYLEKRARQ
ncbi:diguanylate cyclase [Pseudoxanthomonas sp. CAU 1598]|uniref:Diguanylate cyclase n=1 Tax=Pseudomarimonas arenosa TaxID=2774145 RepID=A0AAW3ZH96_9GAMM|nr:diguanylate cyclase [Pseudomarimonas arenosa]